MAAATRSRSRTVSPPPDDRRDETLGERDDRNLNELLAELRVVVTGVQVLFAFLLIVPFNVGFEHVGRFERTVYFVTLLLAAASAACMIAPAAWHRILFRQDEKEHLVVASNRVAIAGLFCLWLAICGSVLVVATKLYGPAPAAFTAGATALVLLLLWVVSPLRRRVHD
jgi:hypothetical protein